MLEHITASEVAGYGVGALLLCATITAPKIDSFISASQRSSLGMCKRCGDLKLIACSNCKGSGSLKQGGSFSFGPSDVSFTGGNSMMRSLSCNKCRSRGHFPCPECSKVSTT
ncbi:hypothetical protein HanPI659440_Chr14g0559781 [Helianthus annuus]|uniref:Uncharacterized protein n=1 Tax=Helianthus annuus TaxID=4232 RepID=A0A251SNI6_HELAN|nr:uncharacterized protein LOC110904264 [Helianthus annuus]KAJ0464731.1 hypothetical protein HanHA300_Chr14g0530611 [Helianthus annuus]KAJ0469398.1 hypothetical protein HanIR_Chr14g0707461 [Helianthus annuus]KAJ0486329.1 hypothetical protein HanHA89_Chr14g0578491 [Helianthus annuus]KAJ0656881.1 hypothetical protein HanLR1_Chr14g0540911 [Helianthus annuus]KAJ0660481.1 hypothetical protein HanOQP8_Chr14g0538271 [Helianthus annuus]